MDKPIQRGIFWLIHYVLYSTIVLHLKVNVFMMNNHWQKRNKDRDSQKDKFKDSDRDRDRDGCIETDSDRWGQRHVTVTCDRDMWQVRDIDRHRDKDRDRDRKRNRNKDTVCPRRNGLFHVVSYYLKLVVTGYKYRGNEREIEREGKR